MISTPSNLVLRLVIDHAGGRAGRAVLMRERQPGSFVDGSIPGSGIGVEFGSRGPTRSIGRNVLD